MCEQASWHAGRALSVSKQMVQTSFPVLFSTMVLVSVMVFFQNVQQSTGRSSIFFSKACIGTHVLNVAMLCEDAIRQDAIIRQEMFERDRKVSFTNIFFFKFVSNSINFQIGTEL